jgi:hypothetical protein
MAQSNAQRSDDAPEATLRVPLRLLKSRVDQRERQSVHKRAGTRGLFMRRWKGGITRHANG